jgi:hydrogenase maturation protease
MGHNSGLQQSEKQPPHVLVIGVGNEYRHDDAVGLVVARALKDKSLAGATVLESTGEGTDLIEAWADADRVILVDAVVSKALPGTLHQIDISDQSLPFDFFTHSTHAFGVAEAIELARTLNCLPPHLLFFGIEGQDFATGVGLSAEVERAVPLVVNSVLKKVKFNSEP